MPRDLGQRAQEFREKRLAPSGGWLSELTILVSDVTRIWDIVVLGGVFVVSWIVIRTSAMEIAMILALGFDLVIPLQYHNNKYLARKHSAHLESYWPVLLMGCLIEGICFFLLHPDLFTLVVCIKTSVSTMVWFSRDQGGRPIKISRSSESSGGSESKRESSSKPSSRSVESFKSDNPSTSSSSSSSSTPPPNMPASKRITDPYKYLHRAGYSDPAIAGMILALNRANRDDAKKNMKMWVSEKNENEVKRRNTQYAERAKKAGWPGKMDGDKSSGSGGSGKSSESRGSGKTVKGKTMLAIPEESIKKAEAVMKKHDIQSSQRKKVLSLLKDPKSEKEVQKAADILRQLGVSVKTSGGSSSSSSSSAGVRLGEPDGKGLFRDIELDKDVAAKILKGLIEGGMAQPKVKEWQAFLNRPLSRGELERKVIPLAMSMDIYLGSGLHGGGPHRLDPKRLKSMQPELRERCGVDTGMADHMILVAINQKSKEEVQVMLTRWMNDGLSRKEFEQLRKTGPDWA